MREKKTEKIRRLVALPGVLLSLAIAVPAWLLGRLVPTIGGAVFAIVAGILFSTCFPHLTNKKFVESTFSVGIKFTSKKMLQYSIILLGFEMNLFQVLRAGGQSLFVMLFTLVTVLLVTILVGRALALTGNTATLIGVGTAICGGSAIAATAPVIKANEEEVSQAISTIFLFNIAAVFLFPALGHLMEMSDLAFGVWAGTAINDTSSVVAAGSSYSAGALQIATIVKLTRTLMIIPITIILSVYTAGKTHGAPRDKAGFHFSQVFPWFVLLFLAACILSTFVMLPLGIASLAKGLSQLGKFMIVMAMAAIGLSTNLKKLLSNGFRPIVLGLSCWVAVALASLLAQKVFGVW